MLFCPSPTAKPQGQKAGGWLSHVGPRGWGRVGVDCKGGYEATFWGQYCPLSLPVTQLCTILNSTHVLLTKRDFSRQQTVSIDGTRGIFSKEFPHFTSKSPFESSYSRKVELILRCHKTKFYRQSRGHPTVPSLEGGEWRVLFVSTEFHSVALM